MSVSINGTTGVSIGAGSVTFPDSSTQSTAATGFGFKNRIINGAMMIDQRNAGASVTPSATQYTLDRWVTTLGPASKFSVQQNAGSVTPPAGFVNYIGITSTSAYTIGASESLNLRQYIEGLNVADLAWGTINAATVTISFWVRSSLTGSFGGAIKNDGGSRSYPFNYTISSANTWEQKSITIPGDTSGTWLTTNGTGLTLNFNIGSGSTYLGTANTWASANYNAPTGATSVVGTNGATFYITGVQLEKGSTATSFDYRPYGTELALCQRYFQVLTGGLVGAAANTTTFQCAVIYPVCMRAAPSSSVTAPYRVSDMSTSAYTQSTAAVTNNLVQADSGSFSFPNFTGMTTNRPTIAGNSSSGNLLLSAEL